MKLGAFQSVGSFLCGAASAAWVVTCWTHSQTVCWWLCERLRVLPKVEQAEERLRDLGWDKHSYGYHGDDGHSFCSSGTGQPYGPTFTTGDVIGCCVNLINGTCFYTKNGHSLGCSECSSILVMILAWCRLLEQGLALDEKFRELSHRLRGVGLRACDLAQTLVLVAVEQQ
ncbi:hypothetical protein P7K49_036584 [Saguinus oedipus]|uniref:SPRY domain-containing protein n=1 Tax=Saguinus oedipus TaxID=9490 RepID=A0ABQ9TKQ3_SAGOE|nr:hypothetical protein P7K49_036584 [Saguinus oedipus]